MPSLVSCIMPTFNRRQFVPQAVGYFLRQDYAERELLIVDDGDDPVGDLVPSDPRVRYIRCRERLPLGSKRNLACQLSRGEFVAHWDDDDWIAPDRLSRQVEAVRGAGADVCGLRDLLHYAIETGQAWHYRPLPGDAPWLFGGTLLYRRSLWERRPFPEITVGEDAAFIASLDSARVHGIDGPPFYMALLHGANTAAKRLGDPRWHRSSLDSVSRLLEGDRGFYVALRNGSVPVAAFACGQTLTLAAPFQVYDGYGSMAEYLALGMARAGATLSIIPLNLDVAGLSAECRRLIESSRPQPDGPALYFCWPRADLDRLRHRRDLFVYTMWESSRLPRAWPAPLGRARRVLVPSRFLVQVFRESGVTAPVSVIPLGVDPAVYPYLDRPQRPGLTTLIVGTAIPRKHTQEAVAAWKLAFSGDRDARLILKSRFAYGNYTPDDPRIALVDSNETTRGIAHWYEQADVLLALGNEGFGLPVLEGMATGLPVIALNSEGQSDVCREARDLLLPVEPSRFEEANDEPYGPSGLRGVPGIEDVAEKLRWVASHREEARSMARAASAWVHRHRNVWDAGPSVLDVIESSLHSPRPLRRVRTLYVTSWQTPCGIAEYTNHLAQAIRSLDNRALDCCAAIRSSASLRLLHIQHEPSLLESASMTQALLQARHAGVPTLVTEHAVTNAAQDWERNADVLVSTTALGQARLRERWPAQRIEHIPIGCQTWFPPRKQTRGRVIGAFGFLERHKGFHALLDAVRAIPGAELLLFSHARSPEGELEFARRAHGLPVRRIAEYLPAEEIACRLAAEADVLVFWYDPNGAAAASAAVRLGLATGVPVLTSRTDWFEGLSEVVWQCDSLVEGIRRLLEDAPLGDNLAAAARDYCHQHNWHNIARRHLSLWRDLEGT